MKKTVENYNFIDTLGEAYEDMLESAEKKSHQIRVSFRQMINGILGNKVAGEHAAHLEESMNGELIRASSYNFIDTLGEAYEALLVSTQQKMHLVRSGFHRIIQLFWGNNAPDNKSGRPEE